MERRSPNPPTNRTLFGIERTKLAQLAVLFQDAFDLLDVVGLEGMFGYKVKVTVGTNESRHIGETTGGIIRVDKKIVPHIGPG